MKITNPLLHPLASKAFYAVSFAVAFFLIYRTGLVEILAHEWHSTNIAIELGRSIFPHTYSDSTEMRRVNEVNYPAALFTPEVQKDKKMLAMHLNSKYGMSDENKI